MKSSKILFGYLWNGFVLAALAGIGVWGHETDWTFTKWAHHAPHADSHAETGSEHAADASAEEHIVEFDSAADVQETGIRFMTVTRRPMAEFLSAPAIISYVPSGVAHLSARVPGTVWRVERRQGDQVKQGDVLAILDALAVGEAKSEYLQSMVQEELKERNVERLRQAADVTPERLLRESEAALREAQLDRYHAQQALVNLGLHVRFEDLVDLDDEERARHLRLLGLPKSLVSKLDPASTSANLIPVVAPFDGVLVRCEIVRGEVISPDHTALVLANVDQMLLRLSINKEDALRIAPGQDVQYSADGIPGKLPCKIRWIGTEVDEKTRSVIAIAELANPRIMQDGVTGDSRLLKANTFGVGHIRVRETDSSLVVPESAVQWDGHRHIVFLAHNGNESSGDHDDWHLEAVQVSIGTMLDGYIEILSGLSEGDQIVADGSHMLKSELSRRLTQRPD